MNVSKEEFRLRIQEEQKRRAYHRRLEKRLRESEVEEYWQTRRKRYLRGVTKRAKQGRHSYRNCF